MNLQKSKKYTQSSRGEKFSQESILNKCVYCKVCRVRRERLSGESDPLRLARPNTDIKVTREYESVLRRVPVASELITDRDVVFNRVLRCRADDKFNTLTRRKENFCGVIHCLGRNEGIFPPAQKKKTESKRKPCYALAGFDMSAKLIGVRDGPGNYSVKNIISSHMSFL